MEHRDKSDIVLDRAGVLEAKEDCGPTRFARLDYIICPFPLEDQIGELFEPAVPLFDIEYGFPKSLVVRDSDMHRVNSTFAHLAKDLLGPVGVLQAVNQDHRAPQCSSCWRKLCTQRFRVQTAKPGRRRK